MGKILVVNGALFKARLLQSALTQYGGYPDDGYYHKGLPRRYAIYTTGRYAGTVAITLNAKTDNHSNNCVRDLLTGLMWSRYVSASVGPSSDGTLPFTTNASGEGLFPYVAAANAAALADYTDWRIPNILELTSIKSFEAPSPIPNPTAFPTWPAAWFLTATTDPIWAPRAVWLNFVTVDTSPADKGTAALTALVRGG